LEQNVSLIRWRIHIDMVEPAAVRPRHLRAAAAFLAEDSGTPHDASRKPFTILPLFEDGSDSVALELTTLTEASAVHVKQTVRALVASGGRVGHLGPDADAVIRSSDAVEVLDTTSYEELLDQASAANLHRMRFLTPATFANEPFPTGRRVYGHLRGVWDTFAPEECRFRLDLADVAVRDFELSAGFVVDGHRDRRGRFVDVERLGSIGWAVYDVGAYADVDRRRLSALAAFADFAGAGGGTSMGLGVTRHEIAEGG
jgi:hypothetical protein